MIIHYLRKAATVYDEKKVLRQSLIPTYTKSLSSIPYNRYTFHWSFNSLVVRSLRIVSPSWQEDTSYVQCRYNSYPSIYARLGAPRLRAGQLSWPSLMRVLGRRFYLYAVYSYNYQLFESSFYFPQRKNEEKKTGNWSGSRYQISIVLKLVKSPDPAATSQADITPSRKAAFFGTLPARQATVGAMLRGCEDWCLKEASNSNCCRQCCTLNRFCLSKYDRPVDQPSL